MSGSVSPQLNSSVNSNKTEPTQSSDSSPRKPDSVELARATYEAKSVSKDDNTEEQQVVEITDLTKKQISWVFATTCYAFGVLKRDFSTLIDQELIAIVKSKLDDEPGFHNDTLEFGNNYFQDQLERIVHEVWLRFMSSTSLAIDLLDYTQPNERNTSNNNNNNNINNIHIIHHNNEQQHQLSVTDDNSTTSAIEQNKATPNGSSGDDSVSNDLQLFNVAQVRKVYLGGISDDIEEPDLREYFKEYGTIADINIVLHKDTGKRRGFAFVEYEEHEPVDKIVSKKFHTIKGRRIEAKKAIPKVEMDARKRIDQRVSLTDAMMVLRGSGPAYLWDGLAAPYSASSAHLHAPLPLHAPAPPTSSYHLDHHHHYPHHYHAAAAAHYGASGWLMHGSSNSGARGSGANGFPSQTSNGSSWAASVAAVAAAADYGRMPLDAMVDAAAASGGLGPMRTHNHGQHGRNYRPYASGGGQRARGFK